MTDSDSDGGGNGGSDGDRPTRPSLDGQIITNSKDPKSDSDSDDG